MRGEYYNSMPDRPGLGPQFREGYGYGKRIETPYDSDESRHTDESFGGPFTSAESRTIKAANRMAALARRGGYASQDYTSLALAWIVSYVQEHPEFFPDGNPRGDHAEGEWYTNALAYLRAVMPNEF